jgi:hypothetical protein
MRSYCGGGKSRVGNNVRSLITSIVALLGTVLSSSFVLAADYGVDFGVETDAGKDAGSLTCLFNRMCNAKMESFGLRVSIHVLRSDPERARVYLDGDYLGCCYFDGGARSIEVDPRKPLSRVPFFKGIAAKGAFFIQNERVGTLYLRFDYR